MTDQPQTTRCPDCAAVVLVTTEECGRCRLELTTVKPKWSIRRNGNDPRAPWFVSRSPVPEDDTRIFREDDRACIDGSEFETYDLAAAAVAEGLRLDADIFATFTA